jgi:hypothetical protein
MYPSPDRQGVGYTVTGSLDELDFGDEIRGVTCPHCGGSLVWNKGHAYCDEDGLVEPVPESISNPPTLSEEDLKWLRLHKLEDDFD